MGDTTQAQIFAISQDVQRQLLDAVLGYIPSMRACAQRIDAQALYPSANMEALCRIGVLTALLPRQHGGLGLATDSGGTTALLELLRVLGRGNLSIGRLVEGHANALRLIWRYGSNAQLARAAIDTAAGHLFGVWNTEESPGVRRRWDGTLTGRKTSCSAASVATRAVITVDHPEQSQMLIIALSAGERSGPMPSRLQGMRATGAGWVDFESYRPQPDDWLGSPHDYLRQPEFSVGAWRTLAVLLGGIEALGGELREQLLARGRNSAPYQADRIAHTLIAEQTAFLWAWGCAHLADRVESASADIVGYVNLARRAVEMAALKVMELVQRSLGLAALVESNPVERMLRDLATYLRQPAIDAGLAEAAEYFVSHPLPRPVPA